MSATAVVIGASVAGVRTAQALVAQQYPGRVVLVGEEPTLPYDKPPLSKDLLVGKAAEDGMGLLRDGDAGIELMLGHRASHLDLDRDQLHLEGGDVIDYDHAVVATGARARQMAPEASAGLYPLRTLEDGVALRDRLSAADSMVVIGAGFIGAEVASSACSLGVKVTLVDPQEVPLARVVGDRAGLLLRDLHASHGADLRLGTGVEVVEGGAEGVSVQLTDGSLIRASLAVVGIGAVPNDEWLATSGLRVADGLVCDEWCRALGAGNVLAAGDVARWHHPRHDEDVRVEHWTNAVEQAACVAYNILHPDQPRSYDPVEYVWTDQYDWKVQITGRPGRAVESVAVGSPGEAARWALLYSGADDELVGSLTVGWPRGTVECRRLLAAGSSFAPAIERLRQLHG